MPHPLLDYLQHNGQIIEDFFVVIDPFSNEVLSVKKTSTSAFLFSHVEAEEIIQQLSQRFMQANIGLLPWQHNVNINNLEITEFVFSMNLGSLSSFQGFHDLPVQNFQLGIVCSNDYSYDGQLEISLWYSHRSVRNDMMVLDKWSAKSSKVINDMLDLPIGLDANSFDHREYNINLLVNSVFTSFNTALEGLERLIRHSMALPITRELILPVFLNIRNKNRSFTALKNNKSRRDSLRKEIDKAHRYALQIQNNEPLNSYLIFLILISACKFDAVHYDDFNDFKTKLTSSDDYKDLNNMVISLNNEENKIEFEHEQLSLYGLISQVL